jgi:uncharacterized protein (TIGR03437 family)
MAERFGDSLSIDLVTAAQRFYETHEDAYDYLVIYNNMDIPAQGPSVIAFENTIRSRGTGYGIPPRDDGAQYGSASRLQAVINMGPLSQYPADPNALVPGRAAQGDTPITTLGHEAGHLYLAFASIPDPNDPTERPMLGYQNQHWNFLFNSEASLLEGERIQDRGPSASPRFITTDTAEGYAPLDQYLMGWRSVSEVPDTFLVTGAPAGLRSLQPLRGVQFDGQRQNISAAEVERAMGRRTPDYTVAQRRYRFAFLMITAPGTEPAAAELAQIETYRQQFELFFGRAATGRASADISLRRSLKLSLWPASGVAQGASVDATIAVATAPAQPMTIGLRADTGAAGLPASVTIPAGAKTVSFRVSGTAAGVSEVTATPADPAYETAYARIQVGGSTELRLTQVSSDPLAVRLSDANGLPYPGASIVASASGGGSVSPSSAPTDADGQATFRWTPGAGTTSELQIAVASVPSVMLALRSGPSVPAIAAVVNAASFASGVAAGSLATVFGSNLAGASVSLDGVAVPVSFSGDGQINFYVPAATPTGSATLVVAAPSGERATSTVPVVAVQPGIFAIRLSSDGYFEIYCTGLGPTRAGPDGLERTVTTPVVFVGATPVQPFFSGLTPWAAGLYQVNVPLAPGTPAGAQVLLSVSLARSNSVPLP